MDRNRDPPCSYGVVPHEDGKSLLLLRLGARLSAAGEAVPNGPLRLLGNEKHNTQGKPLNYAPHSYRCDVEHVPYWIRHCRSVSYNRQAKQTMEEREQHFVAMGYFVLLVLRRWRKWACREAVLRHFFKNMRFRVAMRRWREVVKLTTFLPLLQRFAVRKEWHHWIVHVEEHAAFQEAADHRSLALTSKAWKGWTTLHATKALDRSYLRDAINQWGSWQQLWKTQVKTLHALINRQVVAVAVYRWRVNGHARRVSISVEQGRHYRQTVLGRLLRAFLLRKCLLALVENALLATSLSRLLSSFRTRILRNTTHTWRQWLQQEKQRAQIPSPSEACKKIPSRRRRQLGKPRKGHCRCVYNVSRGQRCICAPRSHLLRRLEELHRLVAQGLDQGEGGYRLLSHVVQSGTTLGGGVNLNGRKKQRFWGTSGISCDKDWHKVIASDHARREGEGVKKRVKTGYKNSCDWDCEGEFSGTVDEPIPTEAAITTRASERGLVSGFVVANSVSSPNRSRANKVDSPASIVSSVADTRRSKARYISHALLRHTRVPPPGNDMTHW